MKKTVLFFAIILCTTYTLWSQSVGIANQEIVPHASAALEIRTTEKGILIPRMTQAEKNFIPSPATGLLIYQTDNTSGFYYFNGTVWQSIGLNSGDSDNDPTNEIQYLSILNDTIYLSNGGYVSVPRIAPGTDEQRLRLSGDSLYITNGNYVLLTPVKDNLGNHSALQNLRLNTFYLSADGDNEGLRINTSGNAEFSNNLTVNGTSNLVGINATGTVNLGENAIQSSEIDNAAVTSAKIADNSIITSKIQDAQITAVKLHPMGASTDQFLRYNGTSWAPASISGGLTYRGAWNASSNSPFLTDATGVNGWYYIVSVAGSQNLGSGAMSYDAGDWAIHNGSSWQKINNSNDVNSVFGRTGAITAQIGDYRWNQIDKTISSIDDITDVNASSIASGNLLIGNGTQWVSQPIAGDISLSSAGIAQIRNRAVTFDKLQNATGAANTILVWNGASWQEALISSLEGDGSITNEIQDLSLSSNILSLTDDATSVSLAAYLQDLSLSGNSLSLSGDASTVNLSGYIQDLSLTGTTLSLSGDVTTVSLAPLLDNTDSQTLSFTNPDLSISGGNSVNISAINTDNQTLSLAGNTLSLTNGGSVTLPSADNLGNHTATSNIILNNHWLSGDGENEGIYITPTGRAAIGNTNPIAPLHISSNDSIQLAIETNSATPKNMIYLRMNGATNVATNFRYISFVNNSNTVVGSIRGNSSAGVVFENTSDRRLKDNIVLSHYGLDDLLKIRVYDYNFKNSNKLETGFIAQDLYLVYPMAVGVGGENANTDPWGVDYSKLTPLLTISVQELAGKLETLEKQNIELRQLVNKLNAELAKTAELEKRLTELEKLILSNQSLKNE